MSNKESGNCLVVLAIIIGLLFLFAVVFTQGQNGTSGLYQLFRAFTG